MTAGQNASHDDRGSNGRSNRRPNPAEAAARETAAFMRGFTYGAEQAILATEPLLDLIPHAILRIREAVGDRIADEEQERVDAVRDELRHLREMGPVEHLALFEVEKLYLAPTSEANDAP